MKKSELKALIREVIEEIHSTEQVDPKQLRDMMNAIRPEFGPMLTEKIGLFKGLKISLAAIALGLMAGGVSAAEAKSNPEESLKQATENLSKTMDDVFGGIQKLIDAKKQVEKQVKELRDKGEEDQARKLIDDHNAKVKQQFPAFVPVLGIL
jgi:hypothetical protein